MSDMDQNIKKIMIAEDDMVVAMELEEIVASNGYMISGIAESGEESVIMARQLQPDLILMDIKMPGKLDGIQAIDKICSEQYIPIVLVTGHTERDILDRACKRKVAGYVVKPFHSAQVKAAIEMGLRSSTMGNDLHSEKRDIPLDSGFLSMAYYYHDASSDIRFTQMETRIVSLIREGKRSQDIADILSVSKRTVDWHRGNIREKLGLKKR